MAAYVAPNLNSLFGINGVFTAVQVAHAMFINVVWGTLCMDSASSLAQRKCVHCINNVHDFQQEFLFLAHQTSGDVGPRGGLYVLNSIRTEHTDNGFHYS